MESSERKDISAACGRALLLAEPCEGDSILIYSSGETGLAMLREAMRLKLRCIFCDEDSDRRGIAESEGAAAFAREELDRALPELTCGEGVNIIADMGDDGGLLGAEVRQISQAGRIVVAGKKIGCDAYHMRTMSIKEGKIIGFTV